VEEPDRPVTPLSLRARVLLGAVLWTGGLFVATGMLFTLLILRYPRSPQIFHGFFMHAGLSAAVAVACMMFGLWHVRRGLAPFNRLRARLSSVRDGRDRRIAGGYPSEVQPLVDDLNALLDHRERAVSRAVARAGDLAHGLKTPLAVLSHEAERVEAAGHDDLAGSIREQVERMRRQIDYHLAQARAAASGAAPGASCKVRDSAEAIARTLRRLHAERGLTIEVCADPMHAVRAQREDLDEMLGNVMDNACKWARTRVAIESAPSDGIVAINVDDDGPGLDASMRDAVLQRGVRADEAAPGSGLGLAIVRDLAELYGGSIALSTSPLGGLRAQLRCPAADSAAASER
jgi:signal transduction histidine kinase